MAGSSSKYHGIQQVARQLQQMPQDDPVVVRRGAGMVMAALQPLTGPQRSSLPPFSASQARLSMIASLQSAGWVLQAARTSPQSADAVHFMHFIVFQCIYAATVWLPEELDLPLLLAVTRPGPGNTTPGRPVQRLLHTPAVNAGTLDHTHTCIPGTILSNG
jgi:hypothetical protein